METINMKEVYFNEYCPKCVNEKVDQSDDPCHDCLNEPAREYSHKPVKFEEKN